MFSGNVMRWTPSKQDIIILNTYLELLSRSLSLAFSQTVWNHRRIRILSAFPNLRYYDRSTTMGLSFQNSCDKYSFLQWKLCENKSARVKYPRIRKNNSSSVVFYFLAIPEKKGQILTIKMSYHINLEWPLDKVDWIRLVPTGGVAGAPYRPFFFEPAIFSLSSSFMNPCMSL